MIYSRNYSRLFIDLNQDRNDFCYDLRPAMGRCIIEIRNNSGKIMIFAQGLKPRVLYRIILVKEENDGSLGINAGLINIDDRGKGNLSVRFDPDNVLSSETKIESIGAVLIIVDGIGEIAAPLVGFTGESFVWKNNFKILHNQGEPKVKENKENKENKKNKEELKADAASENRVEKETTASEVNEETENLSSKEENVNEAKAASIKSERKAENTRDKKESSQKEAKAENLQTGDKNGKIADFDTFLEKFRQNMLELEHYAFMSEADKPIRRGRGIHGIDYIKNYNQKIKPFENWDGDTQWYKILPCELTAINSNLWRHLNSPFINGCFKKYKHLILGIKNDGEYIIGVPEIYDESFANEAKQQGFDRFMPRNNKKLENGDMGYWLLDVD